MRLAGASTIDQANDVLQEFLPRFNARFAVAAEQQERAYRPVPTELSLTEAICLKHTRKVARDNTVKYQWRVLQLLPGMDRPSYAGLQAEVLERADGELMISYHGETVDFQESPQSMSSLWGATNPCSFDPELQPIGDDPANVHLNQAQRTLLDSLEPPDEEEVSAKKVVTKVGRGAGSRFATPCTERLLRPSRPGGRRCSRPKGRDSPCGPSPGTWACPGWPPESMLRRRARPPNASAPRSGPKPRLWPHHWSPRINQGDIFAFQLR